MTFCVKNKFSADVLQVRRLKDFIEENLDKWGVNFQSIQDIVLASDEAATNIVMHAYKDHDKNDLYFELTLRKKGNVVEIILTDEGCAFDCAMAPAPDIDLNLQGKRRGGFGVYLMNSLMDSIKYRKKDGKNMTFMLKKLTQ